MTLLKLLKQWAATIGLVLVVAAVVGIGVTRWNAGARSEHEKALEADVKVALAQRDTALTIAAQKGVVFVKDSAGWRAAARRSDSLARVSGSLDSAKAALARVAATPGARPDTVTIRIPAAEVVATDSTNRSCRETVASCSALNASLRVVLRHDSTSIDSLRALVKLVKKDKPKWWLPTPGFGVAAGLTTDQRFAVVFGPTFSWRF